MNEENTYPNSELDKANPFRDMVEIQLEEAFVPDPNKDSDWITHAEDEARR